MRSIAYSEFTRQRGAASLVVVMLLFFVMMLVTAYTSRSLIFEQRTSANQYRATLAGEAAEAGLQWALTQLNEGFIGPGCRPAAAGAGLTFRESYVATDVSSGLMSPVLPDKVIAACVRGAAEWLCQCPATDAELELEPPAGVTGAAPAFGVEILSSGLPGMLKLAVHGCSGLDRRCGRDNTENADAYARRSILLALRGLANPPIAALTSGGNVNVPAAPMRFVSNDPSGAGYTLNAVGIFDPPRPELLVPPAGKPVADSLVTQDAALPPATEANEGKAFFNAFFGLAKTTFSKLPTVENFGCEGGCTSADSITEGIDEGRRMFWVEGNLKLIGPLTLGTPASPVLLVVNGTMTFDGDVTVYGMVYASSITWVGGTPGAASIVGATVSQFDCCGGDGSPSFIYDSAVLSQLNLLTGTFIRVPGSWSDNF